MADFLMMCLAFGCGGFAGFILAAFFMVGARADEPEDFDGGFRANNAPPARTRIWHGSVEGRE